MILTHPSADLRAYRGALCGVYQKRVEIEVLDRAGTGMLDLTDVFQDGQVLIDTKNDVSRSTSVQIIDPRHRFGFDADTYRGGDLDLSTQLRITWVTDAPGLTTPARTRVFTGPATRLSRAGALVTIEAQGREVWGMTGAKRTLVVRRGRRITHALQTMAEVFFPGVRYVIPDLSRKLSKDVVVHPKDAPWKIMLKLAEALNRHLFFDAAGTLRLRPYPTKNSWRWYAGPNGAGLLTPLSTDADLSGIFNRVKVTGRDPKGKRKAVSYTWNADPNHQFSAKNIGVRPKEITNRQCRTEKDCRNVAERIGDHSTNLRRNVAYDGVAVPELDELDIVTVSDDHEEVRHQLHEATIQLGPESKMQVGYTGVYRKLTPKKRRHHK